MKVSRHLLVALLGLTLINPSYLNAQDDEEFDGPPPGVFAPKDNFVDEPGIEPDEPRVGGSRFDRFRPKDDGGSAPSFGGRVGGPSPSGHVNEK
jgi:hypothetical protein